MANRSVPKSEYTKAAKSKGGVFIGPYTGRVDDKVLWRCSRGHEWDAAFRKVGYENSWCPYCFRISRRIPEYEYHQISQKKDGKFLGGYTGNTKDNVRWMCGDCSYEWEAPYNNIQSGYWCPRCAGKARKTKRDYLSFMYRNGIKWIGKSVPEYVRDPTTWRCLKCKTEWETSYFSIQQGSGCPGCRNYTVYTEQHYIDAAREKNYQWIGDGLPASVHEKTKWLCRSGHLWEASFVAVSPRYQDQHCPTCGLVINGRKASRPQVELWNKIGGEINFHILDYCIDIAFPEDEICVEYDCWYWHQGRVEEDRRKASRLIDHGWKVLRIKTMSRMPEIDLITEKIQLLSSTDRVYEEIVTDGWGGERWEAVV